eukprot:COSAG05_NODE_6970_length_873_cov_1.290698_1_plen_20_part_10
MWSKINKLRGGEEEERGKEN